jgi:chemotaxis methyl-accepting protein methylase
MPYIYELPKSVSFRGKGLFGYSFGRMHNKDLEVLHVESETGHDTFMICKGTNRVYYILAGNGSFTIEGREYRVSPGLLVECPAGVEYCYSGRMTMLAFCKRRGFGRKDKFTKWNPDVVGEDAPKPLDGDPLLTRLVRTQIFGKSPTKAFLKVNYRVWRRFPASFVGLRPVESYGRFLHALTRIQGDRAQAHNTFFLRNRPGLDLIQRLVKRKKTGDTVRVAVLACSTGAEVYSIAWAIRTARPDLKLVIHALDVAQEAVDFGERGVYPLHGKLVHSGSRDQMAGGRWRVPEPGSSIVGSEVFERMTDAEKAEFFDVREDAAVVRPWLREGIHWGVADVRASSIVDRIGLQDIVVASNFLCHMEEAEAEQCLRNIGRLVASHGFIFVAGVDLDVRQKVAADLGWTPAPELLAEIHDGDSCLREQWPYLYGGLEPLNKRRKDWQMHYAAAFQVGASKENDKRFDYEGATSPQGLETQNTRA